MQPKIHEHSLLKYLCMLRLCMLHCISVPFCLGDESFPASSSVLLDLVPYIVLIIIPFAFQLGIKKRLSKTKQFHSFTVL